MESPILKQIAKFLQDKKKYKRWLAVFVCLAVVVGFATTAALKMRGKAMTHDERVLNCKLQVHQHAETCYDQEKNIICGYADYVVHKHNDDCYDPHNGNLVCALPEVEAHQHTDECYQEQQALACGLEESEGHQHTEECRTKEQGELTCQAEEHTHTEECQAEDGAFSCGKEEHTHADECYQWTETLTCGQEESEGHHHTEACNQVQKTLVCQRPEIEVHTHGDECYQRVLITPEGEEIVQDPKDNTGVAQEVLAGTANKEVPEGRIEVRRSCGKLQAEEHTHTQENGCIEIREVLDGSDLRPVEEAPAETPEAPADGTAETPADGNENQEGNPENGQTPMDGTEEEQTIVKTFEGDGFKVIAEYKKDANIPEEAELKAEQITAESDEAHYAEREAAFKENMKDENATMKALLKVGFYVNGEEVEPQTPVTLTVQLLGEDGLPEGTPMTIVHFADEGTKKLEGSKAENDTTSFEMESFSEIAIGYGEDDDTSGQFIEPQNKEKAPTEFYLKESFEQNKGEFKMVFTVKGNIPLPEGVTNLPTDEEGEDTVTGNESDTDSEEVGNADSETGNMPEEGGEGAEEESPEEVEESTAGTETGEDSLETDTTEDNQAVESESGTEETGSGEDLLDVEEDTEAASDSNSPESEGDNPEAGGETEEVANSDNEAGNNLPADSEENKTEPGADGNTTDDKGESSDADNTSSENGIEVNKLKFEVKELYEKSNKEIYKAIREHAEKKSSSGETFLVKAFDYSLSYMGQKLDLSECKVTAEITPTDKLNEVAKSTMIDSSGKTEDSGDAASVEMDITVSDIVNKKQIDDLATVKTSTIAKPKTMTLELDSEAAMFAARATGQPNPEFTVEYYANLDRLIMDDPSQKLTFEAVNTKNEKYIHSNEIKLIDTTGGKLPTNGNLDLPIKVAYAQESNKGGLRTKNECVEVYSKKTFHYIDAPSINYFDILTENNNYMLMQIWVQDGRPDNEVKCTGYQKKGDWRVYQYRNVTKDDEGNIISNTLTGYHFTNREESEGEKRIYIAPNTKLRLVYDTTKYNDSEFDSTFYDYDISDGNPSVGSSGNGFQMNTGQQGINSTLDPNGKGQYAFGNQALSDFGDNMWGSDTLNKANVRSYGNCTFGLAAGVEGNEIQFANGINAPKIFGKANEEGKTSYDGKLTFKRNGDSYTLRATDLSGHKVENLDQFWTRLNWNSSKILWTNSFWPLDNEKNADEHFGNTKQAQKGTQEAKTSSKVVDLAASAGSDEGEVDHNSFFGMYYEVAFELVPEYIGPLEYIFFGDDDMWVFLDGQLVCDIGGVHSSVGEYVNLWDYIAKTNEKKTHKLQFFYTERGASGSTCWMHFTLPSVTSSTPEDFNKDYGHLEVRKDVRRDDTKEIIATDDEFEFTIKLTGADGEGLPDDYSYSKYNDNEEKPVQSDLIVHDGGTFTLKSGQYVVIKYLPDGTKYEIIETENPDYDTEITITEEDGTKQTVSGKVIKGVIKKGSGSKISVQKVGYDNLFHVYNLPKTGGFGTTLYTMAGVAAILLGAGFMYRKKFREGRVGGSS